MTRIGLVLGAGGLAGTAFHAGLLAALHDELGWDARDAEVIVGTSAGSTSAALLRGGLSPRDYLTRITGEPMSPEGDRLLGDVPPLRRPDAPARRRPVPASAGLLRRGLLRPGSVPPGALLAAALPSGVTRNDDAVAVMTAVHGDTWPDRALGLCAVRLDTGARVVLGLDDAAPAATVGDAVAASCAIPGYYEPAVIDGVRYVDGGVRSLCNLDVVAGAGLDLVVVSAPMSTASWTPGGLDAPWRTAARAQLEREAAKVRRRGAEVLLLHPDGRARAVMRGAGMDVHARPGIAREVRASALASLDDRAAAGLSRLRSA